MHWFVASESADRHYRQRLMSRAQFWSLNSTTQQSEVFSTIVQSFERLVEDELAVSNNVFGNVTAGELMHDQGAERLQLLFRKWT